ncbi:hypothetical protein ACFVWZ_18770 [Streptomyces sp. NPDC058200]
MLGLQPEVRVGLNEGDRESLADSIVEEARRLLTGPWPPQV